ncbi:uncharacterized protein PHACADRAFT_202352 [Phanerochaete carnosa HHB-10118-sp]|uniref:Glucose-methanol-choline oxidoreductase N-terminal domain-containing protein n=1 Tax=Phanerochaete carnosa (strain HHB-10118-sp) TaxID=650164 RepID=K5VQ31_PHACS|nr:uncharacterized protein PHACADRAFT_202352 [Phanerochaete carnosa HHB-10118-sp]EKM48820.1 hypothetical protein PHACADRAFT_202352 [Phanerochaete carnosa HHB-10118-sp]
MSNVSGIDKVSGQSFDYIIAGGGGCGLTLAARLSEDPFMTVLVLESGGANLNDPELLHAALFGSHFGKPQYDWAYNSVKQKHLNNRSVYFSRGKGLGGSTAINFLGYCKPPARHIDDWEMLGNPGWNWEAHQEILERVERFQPPPEDVQMGSKTDPAAWKFGRNGQLLVGIPPIQDGELKLTEAMENAGLRPAPQPYNGDPNGWFWCASTCDTETYTRSYSTTAFYLPNKDRPNLSVLTDAHVRRVLTQPGAAGNLTATGVEFGYGGDIHSVRATREVILSAG